MTSFSRNQILGVGVLVICVLMVSLWSNQRAKKEHENLFRSRTSDTTVGANTLPTPAASVEISASALQTVVETQGEAVPEEPPFVPPPPPNMDRMKRQGCIVDGILSGYSGKEEKMTELINRSECYYLHRAVETWLEVPDFDEIQEVKSRIKKQDIVYGMFLAEAINTKEKYFYAEEKRYLDFDAMCKKGTKNFWGEHTCVPTLSSSEYRKYIESITQRAMRLGVQSFMFGQIYMQDNATKEPNAPRIVQAMRNSASALGTTIFIGAQTNDITDETYLRLFDYIEGGVGLRLSGEVEDAPCFSRWWSPEKGGWCWALLWNERYHSKANNVFVHFDWNGKMSDDMNTFALMNGQKREETVKRLHKKFTSRNIGFLVPFLAKIHKENSGCYGPRTGYYSPDNRYYCKDEDAFNQVLQQAL